MIPPPGETVIETRKCRLTGKEFVITDRDQAFLEKLSPTFPLPKSLSESLKKLITEGKVRVEGEKVRMLLPLPTLCPEARRMRRLAMRNLWKLYKGKCAATGKDVISIYSPDKEYTVYDQDFYWSDAWDARSYIQELSRDESPLNQFQNLYRKTPHLALVNIRAENSQHTNGGVGNKDCYLTFASSENESSYYGFWLFNCHHVVDSAFAYSSSECYECIGIEKCHKCFFSERLQDCSNCYRSYDCIGCTNCIDCDGLRNVSYAIKNEVVGKEAFEAYLQTHSPFVRRDNMPRTQDVLMCENTVGNHLMRGKESYHVFEGKDFENCRYCHTFSDAQDCMDIDYDEYANALTYNSWAMEKITSCVGVHLSLELHRCFYSILCINCSECFLCFGLRNAQYCILNKQYTKEEYETLVPELIAEMITEGTWWEFFPPSMSPFGYNESVAMTYYPLTREEAINLGFNWSDYEAPFAAVERVIPADKLPRSIEAVPDDVLNWAIKCEVSGKLFRVVAPELAFYRKHSIPLPRKHSDIRHWERMHLRDAAA